MSRCSCMEPSNTCIREESLCGESLYCSMFRFVCADVTTEIGIVIAIVKLVTYFVIIGLFVPLMMYCKFNRK